ncbi:hypothetical protein N1851_010638 [Merluccius polli]|uniref:Uncharacterized protein n=1 Tax=Merluccius polli TaxID=89951 RepID=A0AA47MZ59_MERPO|nr:hypothetical protein N1851_010638 [Merluccius polli]
MLNSILSPPGKLPPSPSPIPPPDWPPTRTTPQTHPPHCPLAEAHKHHISSYRDALQAAKSAHFSTLINSTNRNPRTLFSTVNKLLQPPDINPPSSPELSNSFLLAFNNKISQINSSLSAAISASSTDHPPISPTLPNHPPPPPLSAFLFPC